MGEAEVVVADTEVQLPLKPVTVFGEAQRLACESAVMLAHSVVLPLHKGCIDLMADWRSLQIPLEGPLRAEDQPLGDPHHPSLAAMLDHLGIDQVGARFQAWLARPAGSSCVREYPPSAEVLEDGVLILGTLVAEEDVEGAIVNRLGPLYQLICLLLAYLSHCEGGYNPMLWSEAQPDPAVTIFALELL